MTELTQLLDRMRDDGMALRDVELPTGEVVLFKSVIEAYPGVASVHAPRRAPRGPRTHLVVASSSELAGELDGLLTDLAREIDGLTWKASAPPGVSTEDVASSPVAAVCTALRPTSALDESGG